MRALPGPSWRLRSTRLNVSPSPNGQIANNNLTFPALSILAIRCDTKSLNLVKEGSVRRLE
jgi:hypothetical protein